MTSALPGKAFPTSCSFDGCAQPAAWRPVFSFRPPASFRYKGAPITAELGIAFCDTCRPRFIESGWRALADDIGAEVRRSGCPVDDALSTVELLPLQCETTA